MCPFLCSSYWADSRRGLTASPSDRPAEASPELFEDSAQALGVGPVIHKSRRHIFLAEDSHYLDRLSYPGLHRPSVLLIHNVFLNPRLCSS